MGVTPEPAWMRNRRAIFAICRAFDLGRPERLDFVTTLLDRNVESFNDLSESELHRVRDALEGAVWVCKLQMERKAARRPHPATVSPLHPTEEGDERAQV